AGTQITWPTSRSCGNHTYPRYVSAGPQLGSASSDLHETCLWLCTYTRVLLRCQWHWSELDRRETGSPGHRPGKANYNSKWWLHCGLDAAEGHGTERLGIYRLRFASVTSEYEYPTRVNPAFWITRTFVDSKPILLKPWNS